jgi:hypothetical protein
MGTTRSFDRLANRHITSPPVPSRSCQIPPSRLTLRFLAIFSAQHLPVYDDPSPCSSPSLLTSIPSQSLPCRHRIAPQIKIRCGRQCPVRWISKLSCGAPNSCADPAPSFPPLLWSTPERHGGTIFLILMHPLARKRTCPLPNPCTRPRFDTTLGLRTSDLTYRFCKIHYAFNCNVR